MTEPATVKAIAVKWGLTNSATATAAYDFSEPEEYAVTVNTEGNGTAFASPTSGVTDTEVSLAAEPDTGWEFKQWRVNSGGVAVEDDLFTIGMEDVVITAVFKPQTFTVTFVNYDAAELQSSEVAYGQTPKYEGAEPTRPDSAEFTYAFVG